MKKQYDDTDLDSSLKKLNIDLMWKTKQKQELKKRIITDIEKLESQKRNKNPLLSTRIKKVSLIRKLTYSGIALIIVLGLFIGSTFVSPAMAEMVSKIPFLNSFINEKSVGTIINEELTEKGYKFSGPSITYHNKTITITVEGSNQYYKSVKGEIEGIVKEILLSNNFDAYKVKIEKYVDVPYSEEEKKHIEDLEKQIKKDRELSMALDKVYKKYNILQLTKEPLKNTVVIDIAETETRSDEMKKEVNNILQKTKKEKYLVKINNIDMEKADQDKRWRTILDSITDELIGKKDYKVTLTGYSINPEPRIDISTSLTSSDSGSREHGEQMEKVLKEYLNSEEMQKMVKNDSYKINVYSKDKKKIN
ncbi:DUF4030 domain-containing protein [Peribacillus frigoritolerans]|uniref:DUF4030 domain-containing protein n=1 Tax=Peribacillus frigoritolerans TaxID=450367 RepID=UPI0023DA7A3F|nr:DUF4030 domain-containing protein [Peribacillus frigoritolerans]MDF1996611.1 DUF4030 domain-containing protein [Peribacillus frigoritolerans]